MSKLSTAPSVTATTTHEVKLAPALRKKLLTSLRTYAGLKSQIEVLESALKKQKGLIGALREETGEQSLALEGFKVTLVANIRKKFNPKKFVQLGGDLALYNEAHEDVPVRAFEKITLPGASEDEE